MNAILTFIFKIKFCPGRAQVKLKFLQNCPDFRNFDLATLIGNVQMVQKIIQITLGFLHTINFPISYYQQNILFNIKYYYNTVCTRV